MALRRLGVLLHHHGAGDEDIAPVTAALEVARPQHTTSREVLAIEAHDLRPSRNPSYAVVERGPLLLADPRERRRGGGRQRESPPHERRRRAMCVARAPEERAPRLAKRVERPDEREIPEGLLLQANACRELIERLELPAEFSLAHDSLGLVLAEPFDRAEANANVVVATFAMRSDRSRAVDWMTDGRGWRAQGDPRPYVVEGGPPEHDRPFRQVSHGFAHSFRERSIHIDGQDRDSVTFRISGDDCGRVEAHGLVVEESDVELGGVVELQMSGVIRGERE